MDSEATPDSADREGGDAVRETAWRAGRFEELAGEIGSRLSRVCGHLPDEEFARLVRDIAAMSLRFEERDPIERRRRSRDA